MIFFTRLLAPALLFALIVQNCAPTKPINTTASWVNKNKIGVKKYKHIYIIGLLNTKAVNSMVENDMQTLAVARGFDVWRNQDVFPYDFGDKELARKETLLKIKEVGCDGILSIALKDVKSETSYSGGSSVVGSGYSPQQGAFQQPTADSPYPKQEYYNNFNNYYYNYQTVSSTPGYYHTDKTYFLEANFFDAETHEILWAIQSKTHNPKDIEGISKLYCRELVQTLEKEGVLKPLTKK